MKNQLTFLVGIAVVLVLVTYMFTFQVPYNQVAVLTTFDRAVAPTFNADGTLEDPGSLKYQPGLYFKAPWPIQKPYFYSTQIQVLEDRPEQIQTADGHTVIVKLFLAWRVEDPYSFFRALQSEANAQRRLEPLLRDLKGVVSAYTFDQLVNADPSKLKLAEIEAQAKQVLEQELARIRPGYGIRVEQVGINRIMLPEPTTAKVFERMRTTRERMAEQARAGGRSEASRIQAEADSARDSIVAFARRRADAIRAEGISEATRYMAAFQEDEEFAVFLIQLDALERMLQHNTTFILDANKLWFLSPLREEAQQARPATQPAATPAAAAQVGR